MADEPALVVSSYAAANAALNNRALSRRTDPERYEHGNILDGVVLLLHGGEHRARRRAENPLVGRANLGRFEKDVFPRLITHLLADASRDADADVLEIAGMLAVLLSADIAGIDIDPTDGERARRLVAYDHILNDGVGIEEYTGDPEQLKRSVAETLARFDEDFLAPAIARRRAGSTETVGTEGGPDLLTILLAQRESLGLDDGTILREIAFFVESGSHTSAQTTASTLHLVFDGPLGTDEGRARLCEDLALVQRCVHEAMRLIPAVPRIWRRAAEDTTIDGQPVAAGQLVHIDVLHANRDPDVFGPDADRFDPDRVVPAGVQPYGHAFSGGMHSCLGRVLAAGIAVPPGTPPDAATHLHGIVPIIVQELLRRGARPHPDRPPQHLRNTRRPTRWASYPIVWSLAAAAA